MVYAEFMLFTEQFWDIEKNFEMLFWISYSQKIGKFSIKLMTENKVDNCLTL